LFATASNVRKTSLFLSVIHRLTPFTQYRVQEFRPPQSTVVAAWNGSAILIDVLLLPVELVYRKGSLFQFIGELERREV
jgi:hypothetical protein